MVCTAAAVVFGPGLLLLLVLGVRDRLVLLGVAPAASVGVALLTASVTGLSGQRYGPVPLLMAGMALAGVGGLGYWLPPRLAAVPRRVRGRLSVLGPVLPAAVNGVAPAPPVIVGAGTGSTASPTVPLTAPYSTAPASTVPPSTVPPEPLGTAPTAPLPAGSAPRRVAASPEPVPSAPPTGPPEPDRPILPALTGYPRLVAELLGTILILTAAVLTLRVWKAGLGTWQTWNQDHDTILHTLLTAFIMRTGRGAPWQVMPADVLQPARTVYYPDGFHLLAATIADVFGGPDAAMIGVNAAAATVLGVAWVAGAAALAGVGVRWLVGPARAGGWSWLAAGVGALLAAGQYRPVLELARDNGLLPNASALALVPGVLAGLLVVRPRGWSAAIGIGVACAGVLAVHPSAGLSVGLSVLVSWLVLAARRDTRRVLANQLPVLGVVLGVAALVGAPVLRGALAVSSRIASFPPDAVQQSLSRSLGYLLPVVYGGMFDNRPMVQVWPTLLLCAGVVGAIRLRRALPLVAMWVTWLVVALLAYRNPHGVTAPILSFFYNSAGRVASHVPLFAPALATLGVFTLLAALLAGLRGRLADVSRAWAPLARPEPDAAPPDALTAWVRRLAHRLTALRHRVRLTLGLRVRARRPVSAPAPVAAAVVRAGERPLAALGVLVVFLFAVGYSGPLNRYLNTNAQALSQRWRYPQLYRVDTADMAAAEWLRPRVAPGERIMNSPNDGSTWLYVHDGLPIVEVSTLGVPGFPYTWRLMRSFQNLATSPFVREEIRRLNIGWVYVDSRAPIIGAYGAPDNWTGGGLMTTVPGLTDLDNTPGLILEHVVGSVRIYKVDRPAIDAMW